jgi:hypothetical protein
MRILEADTLAIINGGIERSYRKNKLQKKENDIINESSNSK